MIARLLIYQSPESLAHELDRRSIQGPVPNNSSGTRASHMESGNVNHPDTLYFKSGEKLGIPEARKIKEHFFLKPYSAKGRTVIVEDAGVMTIEAQNALLKTIEELPDEAIFILGSNSEANLLPTILSRCEITRIENGELKIENYDEIERLLDNSIEGRFEYVEKIKDREELLAAWTAYFHQNILKFPFFTRQLLQAEQWHKQNVNIRAILEYLMLVMPKLESRD
ncbi:MAG: hypothetical protein Q7R49_07245 [Candidatus Daviesbacteria bacterium]|nr:hypothetical protein [Candidatus Daviesbacteria bacterium]